MAEKVSYKVHDQYRGGGGGGGATSRRKPIIKSLKFQQQNALSCIT